MCLKITLKNINGILTDILNIPFHYNFNEICSEIEVVAIKQLLSLVRALNQSNTCTKRLDDQE